MKIYILKAVLSLAILYQNQNDNGVDQNHFPVETLGIYN